MLTGHGLPIAPSTYDRVRALRAGSGVSHADLADAYAANAVLDCWGANRQVYGVRRLWHAVRGQGHELGRDQVARLMGIVAVHGARRGVHQTVTTHRTVTTQRAAGAARHPDLVRRGWGTPTGPDQLWVADFSHVWALAGFCYVAFVTDVFSRRILGWRVSTTKTTDLVTSVLEQAVFTRRRADAAFTATGLMESAIGLYKTELIARQRSWTGRAEVERETAEWVHWFNANRLHSAIEHCSPIEYEPAYRDRTTATTTAASTEVA